MAMAPLASLIVPKGLQTGPFGSQLQAAEYANVGVPVVMPKDICGGEIIPSKIARISEDKAKSLSKHRIVCGDIIFPRRGDLGRIAVAKKENEGWLCGTGCLRARLVGKVDTNYIHQYVQFEIAIKWLQRNALGQTMLNLNTEIISNLPIYIPPLPEQTAIANLFTTWDEAIKKTERLIQVKEQKLAGMFQQYMGERAAKEKRWPETSLGKIFSEIKRKVGDKDLDPYSISAGIGFVSQCEKWGKNISGAQHKNYTHLKAGEFAYNKGNSKRYQQGCAYLLHKGEICVPNVFISFKPDAENIIPEFYEHYFVANYHARELKRYITSGARSDGLLNLRKSDFLQIKVPFPPAEEQQEIAEILSIAQQEIDLLKQLTEKYKTQKRGLMQKLLAGEWRVKTDKEATQCH